MWRLWVKMIIKSLLVSDDFYASDSSCRPLSDKLDFLRSLPVSLWHKKALLTLGTHLLHHIFKLALSLPLMVGPYCLANITKVNAFSQVYATILDCDEIPKLLVRFTT